MSKNQKIISSLVVIISFMVIILISFMVGYNTDLSKLENTKMKPKIDAKQRIEILFSIYSYANSKEEVEDILPEYSNEDKIKYFIVNSHEEMNGLVGWENVNDYKDSQSIYWNDSLFIEKCNNIIKNAKEIQDLVGYEPFRADLVDISNLLENALKNQNYKDLVKAHRILHDLDYFLIRESEIKDIENNQQIDINDRVYWGVTNTLERKNYGDKYSILW